MVLLMVLNGCSNGTLVVAHDGPDVRYEVYGLHLLMGLWSTSVPISRHLSLTSAHSARFGWHHVVAYNDACDVALISEDNSGYAPQPFGLVFQQHSVSTYGMSMLGYTKTSNGVYESDVSLSTGYLSSECVASVMTAPVSVGMSGGGVYNLQRQLVGIIVAFVNNGLHYTSPEITKNFGKTNSIFISLNTLSPWLSNVAVRYRLTELTDLLSNSGLKSEQDHNRIAIHYE